MMMTLKRLDALQARVASAPASLQRALMVELAWAWARRQRERGPSKAGRRMRRRLSLGRLGTC
ncbi:hypothetical protein M9978_02420 [Sphingomonas sp. MG17]|uniref:Uncharacterized protein n=1 Tax=Sphingomonas tagetis TaxID=2949092 RepID=A0A9X2HDS8_9SPHN|nr:hypothetical protein [Sphingomonas tagetis]MCP3729271.1 hypothetical protein [Sphingomonas tagetis]